MLWINLFEPPIYLPFRFPKNIPKIKSSLFRFTTLQVCFIEINKAENTWLAEEKNNFADRHSLLGEYPFDYLRNINVLADLPLPRVQHGVHILVHKIIWKESQRNQEHLRNKEAVHFTLRGDVLFDDKSFPDTGRRFKSLHESKLYRWAELIDCIRAVSILRDTADIT